ncbi:MAG: P-loop containing nucleoside triphosphate hydrolase protein [Piptocephalis tieghemiana]|nr:MAG: P-loop containing nucleoside triphosphate hydrolase protein [Piptocephalis tieghemiana]
MGGLETSIKTVKELIEGSIRDPESFIRLGLKPPKGVLLYGPPGTGKTLLARKVAIDLEAHVLTINGPEIIGKFYGETESRLRDLFHEAEKESPTVIIIDEIDALCPGRGSTGSNEQENRIVATLLTLMDGLAEGSGSRGSPSIPPSVVVIATTNRPDSLDSAIRRPGRLDREVEIGIPSAQDRSSILRVLMSNVPHTLSDDLLDDIASRAHGFVGADLSALCREAAVRSIRRHILQSAGESLDLPVDRVRVDLEDLEGAFTDIRPSGMREIAIEVPRVLWTDIGGQEGVKQKLRESVEWSLKYPEAFTRMGIRPPRGILLYGPPGCSKTLMAKALATEMGVNFIAVKGPELFSKWVGESEKAVQSVFRKARANAPSIIFFDEVDALTVKRGGDGSTSVADRVLSQFLNEMDGVESLVDVTVVAATNRPDIIDAALLRPGRIDRILYIGPPDAEARREIFRIQLARMPCAGDVDVGSLVEHTDGCSGAEVVALCQDAALAAMEESLQVQEVSGRHFDQALKSLQRRITPGMLQFYRNFQEKSGLMSV